MSRRAAIVTGANRGIGLAISEALAASGFDILAADLAPAPSEALQAGVERNNGRLAYQPFDLADLSTHAGVIEAARKEFGSIDCLVNNAGMASPVRGDLLDLMPRKFRQGACRQSARHRLPLPGRRPRHARRAG